MMRGAFAVAPRFWSRAWPPTHRLNARCSSTASCTGCTIVELYIVQIVELYIVQIVRPSGQ